MSALDFVGMAKGIAIGEDDLDAIELSVLDVNDGELDVVAAASDVILCNAFDKHLWGVVSDFGADIATFNFEDLSVVDTVDEVGVASDSWDTASVRCWVDVGESAGWAHDSDL